MNCQLGTSSDEHRRNYPLQRPPSLDTLSAVATVVAGSVVSAANSSGRLPFWAKGAGIWPRGTKGTRDQGQGQTPSETSSRRSANSLPRRAAPLAWPGCPDYPSSETMHGGRMGLFQAPRLGMQPPRTANRLARRWIKGPHRRQFPRLFPSLISFSLSHSKEFLGCFASLFVFPFPFFTSRPSL